MPTSPATEVAATAPPRRDRRGGFALIELMLALAIISLLAALALPSTRFGTGPDLQRYEGRRLAALLRADRNEALRSGRAVGTRIDLDRRRIVSGGSGETLVLSRDVALASRPAGLGSVVFAPDGRSSGGDLVLTAGARRLVVRIDPLTAAVQVEDVRR